MTPPETGRPSTPGRPILVCMSWRGGERLARCLASIEQAQQYFSRVIISVTAEEDSDDTRMARAFADAHTGVEVLCTGRELPTMDHQEFWIDYLRATGAQRDDWICWLAYDDEVRVRGIQGLVDDQGNWPLTPGTAYLGPWAMRHEQAEALWAGDAAEPVEVWTCLPSGTAASQTVAEWIRDQLRQPTYLQMSGSVCEFGSFIDLHSRHPRKHGPMRIEMAVVATPETRFVDEFPVPITVIYGRSNSDRASYGSAARREDLHLLAWLARYVARHPGSIPPIASGLGSVAGAYAKVLANRGELPAEEWRVRGQTIA